MTDASDRSTPAHRRTWIGLTGAAVAVALAITAAAITFRRDRIESVASARDTNWPTPPAYLASPTPPTDVSGPLIAVADLLVAAPADATPGRYYYTRVEQWSRTDDQIVGFLRENWRTDDGSLIQSEKRIPGQPAATFDMARIGVPGTFNSVRPTRDTADAAAVQSFGERHGRPSGNLTELAKVIDSDTGGQPLTTPCPPACAITIPPIVFFDAITGLYRETYLDRAARAALLRLVAVQPGVTFLGEITDRGRRTAIGVAVTDGGVRFCLLFDRQTGVLLAAERAFPAHVLDDYTLYLTLERRDNDTPTNPTAA